MFYARCLTPEDSFPHAASHHQLVQDCFFNDILGVTSTVLARTEMCTPARFGGRGLTDQSSLVQIAYFASWALTLHIAMTLPLHEEAIRPLLDGTSALIPLHTYLRLFENSGLSPPSSVRAAAEEPARLQQILSRRSAKQAFSSLIADTTISGFHRARLRSNSGKGAAAMITAAPTGGAFQMGPDVYRTITRYKMGLPTDSDLGDFCRCGHALTPHAGHLATCTKGTPSGHTFATHVHDQVTIYFHRLFKRYGYRARLERSVRQASRHRYDLSIRVPGFRGQREVHFDVSITNPTAPSYICFCF